MNLKIKIPKRYMEKSQLPELGSFLWTSHFNNNAFYWTSANPKDLWNYKPFKKENDTS